MQSQEFNEDFDKLQKSTTAVATSSLKKLDPFVDADGVIRVERRLSRSNTSDYDSKYPIILPKTKLQN